MFNRRITSLISAVFAVAFVAVFFDYRVVKNELVETRQKTYRALLAERSSHVDQWMEDRLNVIADIAAEKELRTLTLKVLELGDKACASETGNAAELMDIFKKRLGYNVPTSINIAAPDGMILISTSGYCGRKLSKTILGRLVEAEKSGRVLINPVSDSDRVEEIDPQNDRRLIWFESAIKDPSGKVTAYVGYGVDSAAHFNEALKQISNEFDNTLFAFDKDGVRIEGTDRHLKSVMINEAMMGKLSAVPSLEGAVMEPFDGMLEVPSVGVWRWIQDGSLGIGMEIAAKEAYKPAETLRGFSMILGLTSGLFLILTLLMKLSGKGDPSRLFRLGAYRIISKIGEGSVSNVYLAEHLLMRRKAAIKLLKPQFTTDMWIERFKREVRLAGELHHPNFVRVYDLGHMSGGQFYYVMEYVEGANFAELVEAGGPMEPKRANDLIIQLCEALNEAHDMGILHRDIKPQNLMESKTSGGEKKIKILDFGLVKAIDADHTLDLTVGLRVLGTPAYLSPERITDPGNSDKRSDIYSIGAVAFFLLTGRKIFESESDLQLTHKIIHVPPPNLADVTGGKIGGKLSELIASCLAKNPDERPSSAKALAEELKKITFN